MVWKKNKRLAAQGLPDLAWVPKQRCGWDCTLIAHAYAMRRAIEGGKPDLAAWAARHGLPASAKYLALGEEVAILWHGTSRARAGKIAEHGLFSKGGLWTTSNPTIAHSFTRGRSERFATEGAMVCLVMDRREYEFERDFVVEGNGGIFRFHKGLPAHVVEYVLFHEAVQFFGERAPAAAPWPAAKFKKREGRWTPVQKTPARYDDEHGYSTPREFAELCVRRLLADLEVIGAIEIFAMLYSLITPRDAITHDDVFELIEDVCKPLRKRQKLRTFALKE